MVQGPRRGLFALSLDVRDNVTDRQVAKLLQSLRRTGIPATVAMASPGENSVAARVQDDALPHDFAILAEDTWVGQRVGRTKFARELARRVEVAGKNGIAPHTLALYGTELDRNLDLLVKHRIAVVRRCGIAGFQPASLRFGIWQAPVSFSIPSTSPWQLGGLEWTVHRALSKAAKEHGLVHVVADAQSLLEPRFYATFERILGLVQQQQCKRHLTAVTLGTLVELLTPRRQTPASRSVLRVA